MERIRAAIERKWGCIPLLALHQVPEGLRNSSVLLHEFLECFFNGTQNPAISGDHGQGGGIGVGYIPLLECNAPGTGKGVTMKRRIIKK